VSDYGDLVRRAQERAAGQTVPGHFGYRVALDEGEVFSGRWRRRETDPLTDRPVYLLWDERGSGASPASTRRSAARSTACSRTGATRS
jgi:hypothetical protein